MRPDGEDLAAYTSLLLSRADALLERSRGECPAEIVEKPKLTLIRGGGDAAA